MMNKKIYLALVLLAFFSFAILSLSSCGDTEDPDVVPTKSWSEKFSELSSSRWEAGSLADSFDESTTLLRQI